MKLRPRSRKSPGSGGWLSFRYARDEELVGYEGRDTRTSLTMGGGNVVINAVWKAAVVVIYAGLYELSPLRMPADE